MKVVCINSKPIEIGNLYNDSLINLVEKEMYTLEKVVNDKYSTRKAFVLKEIKSSHPNKGFNSVRFRKVDYDFGEQICSEIIKQKKYEKYF